MSLTEPLVDYLFITL